MIIIVITIATLVIGLILLLRHSIIKNEINEELEEVEKQLEMTHVEIEIKLLKKRIKEIKEKYEI